MSNTLNFFRANPRVLVVTSRLVLGALVFGLVALGMMRSRASLRPIVFVAGIFAIVVSPQALYHFRQALGWISKQDLKWVPNCN